MEAGIVDAIAAGWASLPPWPDDEPGPGAQDDQIATAEAEVERRVAAAGDPELAAAVARLLELHERREATGDATLRRRLDSLARVHDALAVLDALGSADAMVARAPRALSEIVGFDRAVLFRLHGGELVAESFHVRDDPEQAERLLAFSREHPLKLEQQILEREMARRRIPMAVQDALTNPRTYKPLATVYQTISYVAAPLMPSGRVIGFVHADHRMKPRRVDDVDRDALWAFAEGLGAVIAHARVRERLRAQASEVERLLRRTQAVVGDYLDAEVELVAGAGAATRTAHALLAGPEDELSARLSRREREVLELLARGASNAQIAAELVIADETAKTHVKRILRKLGAANRVEAATMWLRAQADASGVTSPRSARP